MHARVAIVVMHFKFLQQSRSALHLLDDPERCAAAVAGSQMPHSPVDGAFTERDKRVVALQPAQHGHKILCNHTVGVQKRDAHARLRQERRGVVTPNPERQHAVAVAVRLVKHGIEYADWWRIDAARGGSHQVVAARGVVCQH